MTKYDELKQLAEKCEEIESRNSTWEDDVTKHRFSQAANPVTVLELIAEVQRLEAENAEMRKVLNGAYLIADEACKVKLEKAIQLTLERVGSIVANMPLWEDVQLYREKCLYGIRSIPVSEIMEELNANG